MKLAPTSGSEFLESRSFFFRGYFLLLIVGKQPARFSGMAQVADFKLCYLDLNIASHKTVSQSANQL